MPLTGSEFDIPIAILWAIWVLYWWGSAAYDRLTGKAKKVELSQNFLAGRLQGIFFAAALFLVIATFPGKYYPFSIQLLSNAAFALYLGAAVAALGILFSFWARYQLGANWSSTVQFKKGHKLIETGPYAIVRHPIYLGISIGIIGSAIATDSIGAAIAIPCVIAFSLLRIRDEDKLMREKFGKEYEEYSKRVKAFIPGIA